MPRIFKKKNGGYLIIFRPKSDLTRKERDLLLILLSSCVKPTKINNVVYFNELGV